MKQRTKKFQPRAFTLHHAIRDMGVRDFDGAVARTVPAAVAPLVVDVDDCKQMYRTGPTTTGKGVQLTENI